MSEAERIPIITANPVTFPLKLPRLKAARAAVPSIREQAIADSVQINRRKIWRRTDGRAIERRRRNSEVVGGFVAILIKSVP